MGVFLEVNVNCEILSYKVIMNISGGVSITLEVSDVLSAHRHDTIEKFSLHNLLILHDCRFDSNLLMELLAQIDGRTYMRSRGSRVRLSFHECI